MKLLVAKQNDFNMKTPHLSILMLCLAWSTLLNSTPYADIV